MKNKTTKSDLRELRTNIFRYLFVIGIFIIIFSLFLNYYTIRIYHEDGVLLVEHSYRLIFGWNHSSDYLSLLLPESLDFSENPTLIFTYILIPTLALSLYGAFFKDFQDAEDLVRLKFYSYSHLLLLGLVFFLLFVYPFSFLFSNELYYPFLIIEQIDEVLHYSVDLGYIGFLCSFICIVPYSLIYYVACYKFTIQSQTQQQALARVKKNLQQEIDLDKFIAEEESELGIKHGSFYRNFKNHFTERRLEGVP
ncbi:MAG: membrane protein of unknown function [Promethearchaeota archaeon]|nr:MAG: membrane protein of unknown function [Candidatus Lokiarchaeota archaeon]